MSVLNKVVIITVFFVLALIALGSLLSEQCSSIGSCNECWSISAKDVISDLCPLPNETCTAEPYQMQNNALVDLVLCGCQEAGPDYSDNTINRRIVEVVSIGFGYNLTTREICTDPGLIMSKMRYG